MTNDSWEQPGGGPYEPGQPKPEPLLKSIDINKAVETARGPALKAIKLFFIGVMFLATLAASTLISGLIEEREARQAGVLAEFKQSWGPEQSLASPVLVVPYITAPDQPRQYLKIAPAHLKTVTKMSPEERKRGMFHATVYGAEVQVEGEFAIPAEAKLDELIARTSKAFWSDSFIMLETSGLSGVTANDAFTFNGKPLRWQNCWEALNRQEDCRNASVVVAHPHLASPPLGGASVPFKGALSLRGTGTFSLVFQGKEMEATISAPWGTPSFIGNVLPKSSAVTPDSFEAQWQTLAYSAPQMWTSPTLTENAAPGAVTAGVSLLEATPTYRMIHRASKYNILFVILSFAAYFLFETLTGARIHAIQYGMLGASLTLFALLLASFSEAVGYDKGYALSSGLVLLQASLFTGTVARRLAHAAIFAAMLATLFGFLYVLLSLETYSMIVGSVGLFAVLSVMMALTRNVDWSGGGRKDRDPEPGPEPQPEEGEAPEPDLAPGNA
jgi:inner membrane protein